MVRLCLIALTLVLSFRPGLAAESEAVRSVRAVATLVSDTDAVEAGVPMHLALRLRMAPGWHTYWKNPGDAGVPPNVDLVLPEGAKADAIAWPAPVRLQEGPVTTYGYTGEVLLPMTVVPGAGMLDITANATWLVCERVCVPEEGTFHLRLAAGTPGPSAEAGLFAAAAQRTPRPSPFAAQIAPDGTLVLRGAGLSGATVRDAAFFPESDGVIDPAAAQDVRVTEGAVRIGLTPAKGFDAHAALTGVVVLRDAGGLESVLQVVAEPGGTAAMDGISVWEAVLLAFAGGMVLNLMPCVFPVLALKAFGLARLSGGARRAVRAHAASYTAGVVLAFVGLAAVLLAVRAAGGVAGWGFQFQSPVFVAVTAWVLFLVGLNLSGVFAVGGAGLAGVGQGLAAREGHAGSFFTGLLAVLVATPCTAPFMGPAIAAALAAPAVVAVLVFAAMGLGLAAPYALLALVPSLVRVLPKPGAWMAVAKGVLAFPMYGAAVWLLWVVSVEAGPAGVLAVGGGTVVLGFAAWLFGLAQGQRRGRLRQAAYAAAAVTAVASLGVLPGLSLVTEGAVAAQADGTEPFSPGRLQALRQEGRPVFVNLTAAWCVTCLVNERVALAPDAVRQAFAAYHVAYLKGDWTRGDPAITSFLREQMRDGVPLYLIYPAGAGQPRVLPQILTQAEMLSELAAAGG